MKLGPALYFSRPLGELDKRALQGDMMFRFIGVEASIMQNAFWNHFQMLIKSVQNSCVYIWTFYVHIKNMWKKDIVCGLQKNVLWKKLEHRKLSFYTGHKECHFMAKLCGCASWCFSEFLDLMFLSNGCIYTYDP